jgi:hypothetical protein
VLIAVPIFETVLGGPSAYVFARATGDVEFCPRLLCIGRDIAPHCIGICTDEIGGAER